MTAAKLEGLLERLEAAHPFSAQFALGSTILADAAVAIRKLLAKNDAANKLLHSWQETERMLRIECDSLRADMNALTERAAELQLAEAERDSLRAQLDAARQTIEDLSPRWDANRKDAERYRWLRVDGVLLYSGSQHPTWCYDCGMDIFKGADADAAIDAALAGKEGDRP